MRPSGEAGKELAAATKAAEQGKLGKALAAANKVGGATGSAFAGDIEAHMELLMAQAGKAVEKREMVAATSVYRALQKEAKGTPQAEKAAEQMAAIQKDPELKRELEAAEAFEKTKKSVAKLSTSKKRGKYEGFAKKYAGTRAGDKAKSMTKK